MVTLLTIEQFKKVLLDINLIKKEDLELLQVIYSFDNHQAPASWAAKILGYADYNGHSKINLQVGRTAKRIAKKFDLQFEQRKNGTYRYWNLFFNGWTEGRFFVWQLKPNLTTALEELSLIDEFQYPEEIPCDISKTFSEGLKRTITVNAYERNPIARQRCIDHFGAVCCVCNFDFWRTYGDIGKGFIHVHHLTQMSDIGEAYEVDPIKDLRPVCPNCHSMLHRQNPPMMIEQLIDIIKTAAKLSVQDFCSPSVPNKSHIE